MSNREFRREEVPDDWPACRYRSTPVYTQLLTARELRARLGL